MNIIESRNKFRIVSLAIIAIGLVMFFINGFNYGIEFTGGTLIDMNLGEYVEVEVIKDIMSDYDKDASVVHAGDDQEQVIIKSSLDLSNDDVNKIVNEFVDKYNLKSDSYQSEKFEPLMGSEIRNRAMLSTLIAVIAMLVYITIRFEFNFGVSAIIALVHDILIMLSFYAIFKIPVNSSFIAAILTILGYSINDTIVIFDRIRENIRLHPRENAEGLVNMSIKQSLRRTINTSVTTFIAALAVYVFGVEDIRILALPLMIGIIAGTYSSIFIASPLWYELTTRKTLQVSK